MTTENTARTTGWLALGTATSRALGLVRTILLGAAVGITGSAAADAFAIANRIPNVLFAVAAAGVLNAALVPQIVKSFREGRERTVHRILTLGGFWLLVGTVVLTAMAGLWVRLFSENKWGPEQTALSTAFALWCIPQVFFYGLYTLLGQVLNSRKQFGPYMWAPVANNIVAIAGLTAYVVIFGLHQSGAVSGAELAQMWTPGRIALLAGVATLGIAAQALVLIPPLVRGGYRWRWVWRGPRGELVTVAKVASWALAAVIVEQIAVTLTTQVSSAAQDAMPGDESVAGVMAYDYSLSIYLLPHSLVTVSLMTILFTRMARAVADGDIPRLRGTLTGGIRSIGAFTALATVALVVYAPHLARALAPTSSAETVGAIALVVQCLSLGLMPLGASVLVKQAYFAMEDARGVFLIHIPMAIAWVGIAWSFREWASPHWWVPGVALGLSASNAIALALRWWGLRKRLGGMDMRRVATTHVKALVAAILAATAGYGVLKWGPDSYAQVGAGAVATSVAMIAVGGVVMLAVYLGAARVLRLTEVNDLLSSLRRTSRGNVR